LRIERPALGALRDPTPALLDPTPALLDPTIGISVLRVFGMRMAKRFIQPRLEI
jgi:hypothetical protein